VKQRLVVVGVLLCLLFSASPVRAADEGYPGTTTTEKEQATREVVVRGRVGRGATVEVEACGFVPGATVKIKWNGALVFEIKSGSDGCVRTDVKVKAPGQAVGPSIHPLGGGFAVAGFTLDLSALNSCDQVEIGGKSFDALPGTNELVSSGTGSNSAPREVVNEINIECRASRGASTRSVVAFTGSDTMRWATVGVMLLVVGLVIVALERRRLWRRVHSD
jgi:hypothetical protein